MPDSLLPQHVEVLRERAIPVEFALARGARSIDLAEIKRKRDEYGIQCSWPHLPLHPVLGLSLEYQDCLDRIPRVRVRSDVTSYVKAGPEPGSHQGEEEVEIPRYIAQAGVSVVPYLLPDVLRVAVAGDVSVPLYVVEAPLKAMSLTANGFLAIGLGGVSAGAHFKEALQSLDEIVAHPELQRIRFRGRRVYIVFDAGLGGDDHPGNPAVALGAARVWRALADLGADVWLVRVPYYHPQESEPEEGKLWSPTDQGPDDFIRREGVDAFQSLVDQAVPAGPLERLQGAIEGQSSEQRAVTVGRILRELYVQASLSVADEATLNGVVAASARAIGKRALKDAIKEFEARMVARLKEDEPSWYTELTTDKSGSPKNTLNNVTVALSRAQGLCGMLAWNEFSCCPVKVQEPPWAGRFHGSEGDWTDEDSTRLACYLETEHRIIGARLTDVAHAVEVVSRETSFHPVKTYFEGLKWDGSERLEKWLTDYLHVDDTPYTRMVGKRWMISAVARTYEPGVQADYVLILEGAGRIGKSEALRTIGGDWHSEAELDLHSKEAVMLLQGCLIMEFGEGHIFSKASAELIKKYVTVRYDDIIPKYSNRRVRRPRHNVYAMSINKTGEYLHDDTGALGRWWPVYCGESPVDLDGLRSARDQLWAEAVHLYRQREQWWPTAAELELAGVEQRARETTDPWDTPIRLFLTTIADNGATTLAQVLSSALPSVTADRQDWRVRNRVGNILRRLGWQQDRRSSGVRLWVRRGTVGEPVFVESPAQTDTGAGMVVDAPGSDDAEIEGLVQRLIEQV